MNSRSFVSVVALCLTSIQFAWAHDISHDSKDMLDRGVALVANKKYPEAIKLFDGVIKTDTKKDSIYFALCNRGDAYCMMGSYDKSKKDLDQAVALEPGKESAYLHRATLDTKTGQNEKAVADYSTAISILDAGGSEHASNKFRAGILQERAAVYKRLGKILLQHKDLEAARALDGQVK